MPFPFLAAIGAEALTGAIVTGITVGTAVSKALEGEEDD